MFYTTFFLSLFLHLAEVSQNMSLETAALLEAVKDLKEDSLDKLVKELEQRPKKLDVYKKRTEVQWKELYGDVGIDIFNHLNPGNII